MSSIDDQQKQFILPIGHPQFLAVTAKHSVVETMKNSNNPAISSNLRQISETLSNIHQQFTTNISESKYLPPEVWTLILSTLPAKTLLKFRCVCKSWCSIIDDPDFIQLQFRLCKINSGNNQLLVSLEGLGRNRDKGCLLTVCQPETLQSTGLIFSKSDSYRYRILSSCNGLLLVVQHRPDGSHIELRLWNPCLRKSFLLPTCPLHNHNCWYLLGFAPDSKDFKVVALTFEKRLGIRPRKMLFVVYSLHDQLWTIRNLNTTSVTCIAVLYSLSKALFFRRAAYWLAKNDYQRDEPTHLGSFDFEKENIDFLELPFSLDETGFYRLLFLLGESLAVFSISKVTSSIWVLEQDNEKGPWTLWFSGKSTSDAYQLFFDCIIRHIKLFYIGSDGGFFVCGDKAYNIASCQVKKLISTPSFYFQLEAYSESLVLFKESGARDLRDFP
ncbi:F-box/kelch-repeat protein At3g17530-like [Silene latifolia]|uniref:F-box/kelch-repeat protein At3g17530-like n=1 Tax=Silene latifolia TaxID=37657 RepID=UPI003D785606